MGRFSNLFQNTPAPVKSTGRFSNLFDEEEPKFTGQPSQNWVAEGLKKTVSDIGQGFADIPAQITDVMNLPAAFLGTPRPPMQSRLVKQTLPFLAEKATTPLFDAQVPVVTPRNIKPLFAGKFEQLETTPVSPSAADLALAVGIPTYGATRNLASKMQWNSIINKAIQTEKVKEAIMQNIGPLENIMGQAGIRLPKNLPLQDKVNIIISQAEKSPTLGTAINQLSKGQLKPVQPRGPVIETVSIPESGQAERPFAGGAVEPGKALAPTNALKPPTFSIPRQAETPIVPQAGIGTLPLQPIAGGQVFKGQPALKPGEELSGMKVIQTTKPADIKDISGKKLEFGSKDSIFTYPIIKGGQFTGKIYVKDGDKGIVSMPKDLSIEAVSYTHLTLPTNREV